MPKSSLRLPETVAGVPPSVRTLVELLRARAASQSDQQAYMYLSEDGEMSLTYGELDEKARAIGVLLKESFKYGDRVLLLYPPGLEFISGFMGCLYAGMIAVPAYPPDPARLSRTLTRLQKIAMDAQAAAVLTTDTIVAGARTLAQHAAGLSSLQWLSSESIVPGYGKEWRRPKVSPDTTAFIQYTSGSTGDPKGVVLSHENLLHNAGLVYQGLENRPGDKYLSWLPVFHDMGFMAGVLEPLYGGFESVLMSPMAFLQRPITWLHAISKYKATISGGPNFAYGLCARKVKPEERKGLDLSTWTLAFNGAEPVRADTIEEFSRVFNSCGFSRQTFFPCYGLAEATLIVAGGPRASLPVVRQSNQRGDGPRAAQISGPGKQAKLVSCGRILPGQRVIIVDPESRVECSSGETGEIWVSGPSVARGYWELDHETTGTFQAFTATEKGPFLRTGDLGFIETENLYVTGRLKDLIIVRGRNYHPQDIELSVERSHPAMRPGCCAAFSLDTGSEERVVIVSEVDEHRMADPDEAVGGIRRVVAEDHDLLAYAIVLIRPGTIPKTTSGKIQRRATRALYLDGALQVIRQRDWAAAEADEPEAANTVLVSTRGQQAVDAAVRFMAERVAARSGVDARDVDAAHSIASYGLDSLAAIELAHDIEARLGATIPMHRLLDGSSIVELAEHFLREGTADTSRSIEDGMERVAPGLSPGQEALWFLHQVAPESPVYNITVAARIQPDPTPGVLRDAFQALLDRHESLRTIFPAVGGRPARKVLTSSDVWFGVEEAIDLSEDALRMRLAADARRPFDLENGPLMRITFYHRGDAGSVLLLAFHHIAVDFWSLGLLVNDLAALLSGPHPEGEEGLESLGCTYGDYVRWQEETLAGSEGERLWSYWNKQLAGELPILSLPADKPRPPVQTFSGGSELFEINRELAEQLGSVARSCNSTLYMTLLAAFQALLYRYTGQPDILVGSPSAGRAWAPAAKVVGYFVNALVMRGNFSDAPPFGKYLTRVRRMVLDAFEHEAYPFPRLVERLQAKRDTARSPLFQAMFVWHAYHVTGKEELPLFAVGQTGAHLRLGRFDLESIPIDNRVSQFDLMLTVAETGSRLMASATYNSDLFDATTIQRLSAHFQTLLACVAADPQRRVSDISILAPAAEHQTLVEWNESGAGEQRGQLIHRLIERQVQLTGDAVAVAHDGEHLSYAALNSHANQLAHLLRQHGADTETAVGVCLRRNLSMVVAVLAIIKSGGAYVPLDPSYPKDRLAFMIADARVTAIVSESELIGVLPERCPNCIDLESDRGLIAQYDEHDLDVPVTGENASHVIYTSGSTGKPKGVLIRHAAVVGLLDWAGDTFSRDRLSGVLASTSLSFDLSVFELFLPLSAGGTVVLAKNLLQFDELAERKRVTLINTVPSAARELLGLGDLDDFSGVINLAGEPLTRDLVDRLYSVPGISEVFNLYGPSEDTTYTTWWPAVSGKPCAPPIGRPIATERVYILDGSMMPVPAGVAGEVYIAGNGLARGYLGRANLTAERFVPAPFADAFGERMYRTGDLARHLKSGEIEFLGRVDHQVKIRGFRIELGEVEAVLRKHPAVRDVLVVAREQSNGDKGLLAYILTQSGHWVAAQELREFAGSKMPGFMLPAAFVMLDSFPLSPNGKIDRGALPDADQERREPADERPKTSIERDLAAIWAEVLGLSDVPINASFFELGGHSLLATRIVARVQTEFGLKITVRNLLEAPTIEALGRILEDELIAQAATDETAAILDELSAFSDDELKSLLANSGNVAQAG
jgi:amino acid adenylation domain-containing protein